MPKFSLECTYCGYRWEFEAWNPSALRDLRCTNGNCNDKHIKVKELSVENNERDPFGYRFSPEIKDSQNDFEMEDRPMYGYNHGYDPGGD